MSRREYKTITRRLQRGREASVNEGKYVGNIAPFGYKRTKLENCKGYSLAIEPSEAPIVRQIFILYAYENLTINGVAKKLNILGIRPRIAEEWTCSSIKDILKNPVYIGKIRWNARKEEVIIKSGKKEKHRPRNKNPIIVDGLHTAIIEQEIWDIVQNKRALNCPPVVHNNVVQNSLVGIVYCGKCGKLMQRRPYNKKGLPATLICSNKNCDNISSKLNVVENSVIKALKLWLNNYTVDCKKLVNKNNSTIIVSNRELLERLKKNLEKEVLKQTKIYEYFEDGTYDKKTFKERLEISKANIQKIEDNIKPLEESIKLQDSKIQEQKFIVPKIMNVIDIYDKLKTAEEKNLLLKTVLKKVVYVKNEKAIKKISNPTNFELQIYPKLPKKD